MTEIEQKALALVNEMTPYECVNTSDACHNHILKALYRAIEQHEAFKREVSDAVHLAIDQCGHDGLRAGHINEYLGRFILPKPVDPLVAVMDDFMSMDGGCLDECVKQFRVALARQGLEVREIEG